MMNSLFGQLQEPSEDALTGIYRHRGRQYPVLFQHFKTLALCQLEISDKKLLISLESPPTSQDSKWTILDVKALSLPTFSIPLH